MDKDRIKGKMEEIAGRAQRQAGEWTGDKKSQAEGLKRQIKGKARNLIGQVKDAERDAKQGSDQDLDDIDSEKGAA